MAIRQYIGARYMPKFMGAYDPTTAYEALSVVDNGAGTSYVSNKPTPPGTPLTDTTYWAVYGASSGAILDLQTRMTAAENSIDFMEPVVEHIANKKYIVVADSYGNYTNGSGNNFYTQSFIDLGITDYYDFHMSSAGFTQSGNINFKKVLENNDSVITDKSEITDIIVIGGANDQATLSAIDVGISTFMTYVKANYANATVHIGHFTNAISNSLVDHVYLSTYYYKTCTKYGARYINNSEYIMRKLSFFNTDNVHPSLSGITALTKYFTDFLVNGEIDVVEYASGTIASNDADYTIDLDYLLQEQHNGTVTLVSPQGGVTFDFECANAVTIGVAQTSMLNLFKFTDGFIYSSDTYEVNFQGLLTTPPASSVNTKTRNIIVSVKKIENNLTVTFGFLAYGIEGLALTIPAAQKMRVGLPCISLDFCGKLS